jgi:hypothetical protein
MAAVMTRGNGPLASCRDSPLEAQAHPKSGNLLRTCRSLQPRRDHAAVGRELDRGLRRPRQGLAGWLRSGKSCDSGKVDAVGVLIPREGSMSQNKIVRIQSIRHTTRTCIFRDNLNMRKGIEKLNPMMSTDGDYV